MGFQLVLYCVLQEVHIYSEYNIVFRDYITAALILQIIIISSDYKNIKTSKSSFIQGKKIKQLLDEQQKIFQNLPDGAIIHRSLFKENSSEVQEVKVQA